MKSRSYIKKLVLLLFMFTLVGCAGILDPKGSIAISQKNLIITSVILMLIIVIPVIVMIFSFAWKYRENNPNNPIYKPEWEHSTKIEIAVWGAPIIIIILLSIITWKSSHDLDPYKPIESDVKPITIEVIALDWKWLFIYKDYDIATVNFIQVPENTPINFVLTGDAPMNSFWIPQLAGQIYVMSGMQTKLHIVANEIGNYDGLSANYSGFGFSDMKFVVKASSSKDFETWISDIKKSGRALSTARYNELIAPTRKHAVEYYSSADSSIFASVIAKYNDMNQSVHAHGESIPIEIGHIGH